jgi:hypothetical protein
MDAMKMAVVHVIDMIAVLDGFVTATLAMLVLVMVVDVAAVTH